MSFFLGTVCSNHNVVWCAGVRLMLSQSSLRECVKARLIKKDDHNQHDLLCRTKAINESRNRNPSGLFERISKDSSGDCGKGDAMQQPDSGTPYNVVIGTN